jgi:hypothetical protein
VSAELQARVVAAIRDLEPGVLDAVAAAAVNAVLEAGYFPAAGWEYTVRQGDIVLETGFNTSGQAHKWAKRNHLGKETYQVQRRRVGVWENEPEIT